MIQVWINKDDDKNVETLVKTLNDSVIANKEKELKGFFIFVDEDAKGIEAKLTKLAEKQSANDVALAYLSKSSEGVVNYKINLDPEVKNTVIVYRNKKVTAKFVNLSADEKGLADLQTALSDVLK